MTETIFKIDLPPVDLKDANEEQKEILEKAQEANGMIPNMYRNMVNLPALQATYDYGYKRFREESGFTPAEQEVVFLTVSIENGCDYCTAAHSYIADEVSKTPVEVTNAIRSKSEIPDDKLAALSRFTKIMHNTRGYPPAEDAEAFLKAGYTEKHILGIILAISVKTISNYSNHIFRTEVDKPFQGRKL
jgi:uncharacterized peroxidase-related enzyme